MQRCLSVVIFGAAASRSGTCAIVAVLYNLSTSPNSHHLHFNRLHIMSFNTRNLAPSAEEKTTKKEVEAMGCRFIEYRGEGKPVRGIPPASPGDIYFDVIGATV